MFLDEDDYLSHYGTPRRSGRYPWGSGGDSPATNRDFLERVKALRKEGLSEKDIAEGFGMSTTDLRAAKSIAKNEVAQADMGLAQRLKDKGWSNTAIADRMGRPESTIRSWLVEGARNKEDVIQTTANILRDAVNKDGFIDVGAGTEMYLNVSPERLNVALSVLKQEGYEVHSGVKVTQLGTGKETNLKVLTKPGTTKRDVYLNKDKIHLLNEKLNDTGDGKLGILPPIPLNPNRVQIVYGPDGGDKADGVMYVRPGVEDVSLGSARYAQVRVQVGKNHYLKGMAIYKDGLPDGIDVQFNTNKTDTGNKLDALKPLKDDPDNPFGATIRGQVTKPDPSDPTGVRKINTSVMNRMTEEGQWSTWSDSIASQVLSKQNPRLAREQLDMTYERKLNEFEEISKLTNPAVKRKMLQEFAEGADASAVHLKAANLPRQAWHVILPVSTLRENEIYAPGYNDGERVALIRYPHGGTFEIPDLVVNNRHAPAKRMLKDAKDAVGIHHSVAERLSGADFDGDTVLVIPNGSNKIKISPALEGLKNFNPREQYKKYDGMKVMSNTQTEMGKISNLITDMTIRGAPPSELARAVRHSMVVIDAEKHELNYKQSEKDNNIKGLREKYQIKPDGTGGASTIISRAGSERRIPKRVPRRHADGGPINKITGELEYTPTGQTHYKTGALLTEKKKALEITKNAYDLSSGTPIENIYADHSNRMKDLANRARLTQINTPRSTWSPSAKKTYKAEVASLESKLALAKMNAPLERRAQLIANEVYNAKKQDNPKMDPDQEKKVRFQALDAARKRTGAKKAVIEFTDREWEAIQAGAISDSKLSDMLNNADMDRVKDLATPKTKKLMTSAKTKRAQSMLALGYTRAEVAKQLGVSLSTLDEATVGG